ncbi:MAG: alpha-ketoglutarate-dependent dioxygenase AlkB [Gammaproteobacteria bacterium]|nr:alpha-ketoglutarate-dependent dioxygenase AlkB [Gammaproteobacteria bacterium]MBV9698197.1 alpha-ketoglutarate-dependent dioxygenase AlkB [Gammaproteobacteria bacterium]
MPPDGYRYQEEFLTQEEEAQLLGQFAALPFHFAPYREWQARRRIVSFGGAYDFSQRELKEAPPVPDFLLPYRERAAGWAHLSAGDFNHATVTEYAPGTPLGWHRDVPDFEEVIGISLKGTARMRFRPYPPPKHQRTVFSIELAPRSIYLMQGPARWAWQHAISPTKELRYSLTLRSRRRQRPGGEAPRR